MAGSQTKPMHVVFVDAICDALRPGEGGLSDVTWDLAAELVASGHRVTVVGAYERGVQAPDRRVVLIPVPTAVIRRNNIARQVVRAALLAREARRVHGADVYQTGDSLCTAALVLLGVGRRVVWQGHSNVYHHTRSGLPWQRDMYHLMRLATRISARRIAGVVALGPSLVRWWERSGFPLERICVIPNGIDLTRLRAGREEWATPEVWKNREYRLLYVGRLSAEKGGYLELIGAVEILSRVSSVGLVLVGDGSARQDIESMIEDRGLSGIAACIGQQPFEVVLSAYQNADLVVLPSVAEMMPRVMLEAWAMGVPFMASAVGAIPDYLEDGVNGFLLASTAPHYLSSRMDAVLGDVALRERISRRARDMVADFSWTVVAKSYGVLYREVQAQRRVLLRDVPHEDWTYQRER